MPPGIEETKDGNTINQNCRRQKRAAPQNLLEPDPRTLRPGNPAVPA